MLALPFATPYLSPGPSEIPNLERNEGMRPGGPAAIDGLRSHRVWWWNGSACLGGSLETTCLAVLVLWPGTPAASYRIWAPLWLTVLPLLPCLAMPATFLEQWGVAAWMVLAREKGSLSRTDPWLALVCVIALILGRFRALGSRCGAGGRCGRTAVPDPLILQERLTIHWTRWATSQSGGRGAQEGA
jgi:hypothetical protein